VVKAEVVADGVGQFIVIVVQRALPSTEACQSLVGVMTDLQLRLLLHTPTYKQLHTQSQHYPVHVYQFLIHFEVRTYCPK